MLRYLSIEHLAVIDKVEIEFEPGLNVLTGETGAGKSILVEAVGLLLGARASSDLVRTGEDVATIQAIFDAGDGEVIVRRELTAQGRSRAFVNGALATAATLRDLASRLIELHGQHDHQGLLEPDSHLDLLDAYAGLDSARAEVAQAFQRLGALRAELDTLRLDERQKLARIDLLTFQRDEIRNAAPKAGEDQALTAERAVLANAERLAAASSEAYQLLYEQDGAVLDTLATVWKRVGDLGALDGRVAPYLEGRAAIDSQLKDLALFLRDYAEQIDASPARLQEVEDRIALLERLKRKYGPDLDAVATHLEDCDRQLAALAASDERATEVQQLLERAEQEYLRGASALAETRRAHAKRFAKELVSIVAGLAMDRTRFEIRFNEGPIPASEWGPRGIDTAEFFVSPNPGEDLRPLAKIVSGGELSRLMLGIRSLTGRRGPGMTLIFDEVDAGIGGHAADVVGKRLQELGAASQVLCITHLPQIAAHGDVQFQITKQVREGRTTTNVSRLDTRTRELELARMIAGESVSDGVKSSAAEMLTSRRRAKDEQKTKGESEGRRAKGRT
jgi:DNA repair protein RecN (Recombination protein N)